MEWKKSNISQSELEKRQQAYIKEALEMAKRSVASQFEKAKEMEQAEVERKAAEQAEVERKAVEKAEAERKAAEQAEAERKAAEQAEAERKAAEQAEAERKAAKKAEAERKAAEQAEAERKAAKKAEAERKAAEQAEAERIAAEKAEAEKLKEEMTVYSEPQAPEEGCGSCSDECLNLSDKDNIIDISEVKKTMEPSEKREGNRERSITRQNPPCANQNTPPNFNRYINEHNKNQCNCPNCRKRRAEQQR